MLSLENVESQLQTWLNQFARSTYLNYRMGMYTFLKFMEATTGEEWSPQKLVDRRLTDLSARKFWFETKVVEFFGWLKTYTSGAMEIPMVLHGKKTVLHKRASKPGDGQRLSFVAGVRSFFAFHRLDLKFTRQQKRVLNKKAKPVKPDYLFELAEIRRMAEVGTPQERYILLVGKDLGLRAIDFIRLKQGMFVSALTKEHPVFLGEIWTQKEGVSAFPFLSEDGLEASRVWLQVLESKRLQDDEAPMLRIRKKELSENLKRITKKAGIPTRGRRVRFHCLRKFLIDRLSIVTSESKWKQIVGKKIDEGAYVSPLDLREVYMQALDRIQLGMPKPLGLSEDELEALKKLARMMREGKIKVSS